MDTLGREDLGNFVGFVIGALIAAALLALLRPLARRGRVARMLAWFWAGTAGAALWSAIAVAIGGAHQVYRDRTTGGWHDTHWTRRQTTDFALIVGTAAAGISWFAPRRTPTRVASKAARRRARASVRSDG